MNTGAKVAKKVKLLAAILVVSIMMGLSSVVWADSGHTPINKTAAVTYDDVTRIVEAYWSICGNKYWNRNLGSAAMKTAAYEDTISPTGCKTGGDKSLHSRDKKCTSNLFKGVGAVNNNNVFSATSSDAQCSGFAAYMEYVIFRTTDPGKFKLCYGTGSHSLSKLANNEIKPGDQLRYNGHSYVIYKVDTSKAYYIQCNTAKADCKITKGSETISSIRTKVSKCNGTTSGLFSSPAVAQVNYTLHTYPNHSGRNYLIDSDFMNGVNADYWWSRDEGVCTISTDSENRHDGYNSLRIVNTAAGANGSDIAVRTITQSNASKAKYVGDNKAMILSFWAKCSDPGTRICFRYGYEDGYHTATLSGDWEKYTVRMDKTTAYNNYIHPYVDRAGTVWLAELQLEDGTEATGFVPENTVKYAEAEQTAGKTFTLPEPPYWEGHSFLGWYTAANGGTEITSASKVPAGHMTAYAHWDGPPYSRTFTVSFQANGGTVSTAAKDVSYPGSYGPLPIPFYTGHIFKGWYTAAQDGTHVTAESAVFMPENHTLYARWAAAMTLTLPERLTAVEEEAFAGAVAEYVIVPRNVTQIGARAFADCGKLAVVEFQTASVEIAADTFENCQNLSVVAPAGGTLESFAKNHSFTFIGK